MYLVLEIYTSLDCCFGLFQKLITSDLNIESWFIS